MRKKQFYFLLLKGLGDNLITLSLISKVANEVNILGTQHTKNIADLIKFNSEITTIFSDIPAFYDIKKKGFIKAIKDIFYLRKYLKNNVNNLVFETKDWRVKVLTFNLKINTFYPQSNKDIYINRKKIIESIYNIKIDLITDYPRYNNIKTILINPATRKHYKNITHKNLSAIIDSLKSKYNIILIDHSKEYQNFFNKIDKYVTNTTLNDVKNIMQQVDFYIGGDSFLVHMAYYFNKPYFIVFNRETDDFLPPNAIEECYIKTHNVNNFRNTINNKFHKLNLI